MIQSTTTLTPNAHRNDGVVVRNANKIEPGNRAPAQMALSWSRVGVDAQENAHDSGLAGIVQRWRRLRPVQRVLLLEVADAFLETLSSETAG